MKNVGILIGASVIAVGAIALAFDGQSHPTNPGGNDIGSIVVNTAASYIGTKESPPGSNRSAEIDSWNKESGAAPGSNYCASFVSHVLRSAYAKIGKKPPVEGNAGAKALMKQFISAGLFVAAKDAGKIPPGSVVFWDRGSPGAEWKGHAAILKSDEGSDFTTIEGNTEWNDVRTIHRSKSDPNLIGFGILKVPGPSSATNQNPGSGVLLIGDSMANGLSKPLRDRLSATGTALATRGINGTTIDHWSGEPLSEALGSAHPSLTLISLGTNDLASSSPDYKRKLVDKICETIRASGSAPAWILPPRTSVRDRGGLRQALSDELSRIGIPAFDSEKLDLAIGHDGIHPTPGGFDLWASKIADWIHGWRAGSEAVSDFPVEKATSTQVDTIASGVSNKGNSLLPYVVSGEYESPTWIKVPWNGLEVLVGAHALRAKTPNGLLRMPVSYDDTVKICKLMGWVPMTESLSDAVWEAAAVKLSPRPQQPVDDKMNTVVRYNRAIDNQIPDYQLDLLAADEGKDWVLHPRAALPPPGGAATYGMRYPSGKPIQPANPSFLGKKRHNRWHRDYSQVLRPVERFATKDGETIDLIDVYVDMWIPRSLLSELT